MKRTDTIERQERIEKANHEILFLAVCKDRFLSSPDCGFSYFYINPNTNRLYLKYYGKKEYNKKSFCMSGAFKKSKLYKTDISQKEKDALSELSLYIKYIHYPKTTKHSIVQTKDTLLKGKVALKFEFDFRGGDFFETPVSEIQAGEIGKKEFYREFSKKALLKELLKIFRSKQAIIDEIDYIWCGTKAFANGIGVVLKNPPKRRFDKWVEGDGKDDTFCRANGFYIFSNP